jgi:hypothetical protein
MGDDVEPVLSNLGGTRVPPSAPFALAVLVAATLNFKDRLGAVGLLDIGLLDRITGDEVR